ncbi:MAG: hypothetical protein WAT19_04520 [Ferruginibacter sp.]
MEDGYIYISGKNDSAVYTAGQVQSIMFCHHAANPCPQPPQSPCNGKSNARSQSSSSNSSTFSSLDKNDVPAEDFYANDTEKGTVSFTCNMCGGSGNLLVRGTGHGASVANYSFAMDKDKHYFLYIVKLLPGNYSWTYDDNNNNETHGKFSIGKMEERKIVLFEKE